MFPTKCKFPFLVFSFEQANAKIRMANATIFFIFQFNFDVQSNKKILKQ